jgi:4-hydroxybenzoyl-CoA reductase subunit alpha
VKICLTREEVFYCHRGRHPVLMKFKTGVKRDGTITGDGLADADRRWCVWIVRRGRARFTPARCRPLRIACNVTGFVVAARSRTSRRAGPKRGHGTVQPRFGQEVQLDKIAERLQIDPAELRLRIAQTSNSITANFFRLSTVNLAECIRRVVKSSGWNEKFRKLPEGRGVGLACSAYLTGAGLPIYWNNMPHSGVQLKFDRGGGVTIFCGATEIGQGSDDVLAGIVAEVLGLDTFDARLYTGDTDLGPVDLGSYSSRVTIMAGKRRAASG